MAFILGGHRTKALRFIQVQIWTAQSMTKEQPQVSTFMYGEFGYLAN